MKKRADTDSGVTYEDRTYDRSLCPLANLLDILGDKWTLLVVRDMLFRGKCRYGEFLDSDEGIPTNILADRLKRLEKEGMVERKPYQRRPLRHAYYLTEKGLDLEPILYDMVGWAMKYIPGTAEKCPLDGSPRRERIPVPMPPRPPADLPPD